MKYLNYAIVLALALVGVALAFSVKGSQPRTLNTAVSSTGAEKTTPPDPREMPESTKLMFVFHHIENIKENPRATKAYRERIALSDQDFERLASLAREHEREVAEMDRRAKEIIDAYHAEYPPGPMRPGVMPPAPPEELRELQRLRETTSLRYGGLLKTQIGEEGYLRFNAFLAREFNQASPQVEVKK